MFFIDHSLGVSIVRTAQKDLTVEKKPYRPGTNHVEGAGHDDARIKEAGTVLSSDIKANQTVWA